MEILAPVTKLNVVKIFYWFNPISQTRFVPSLRASLVVIHRLGHLAHCGKGRGHSGVFQILLHSKIPYRFFLQILLHHLVTLAAVV